MQVLLSVCIFYCNNFACIFVYIFLATNKMLAYRINNTLYIKHDDDGGVCTSRLKSKLQKWN